MKIQHIALITLSLLISSCSSPQRPIDSNATEATVKLLNFMESVKKSKKILFGHQDATAYGIGWKNVEGRSDVKLVTGSHPAVYGWELGHIELGDKYSIDSIEFSKIRSEIVAAAERGGINTISWHLRNPLNDSSSWDMTPGSVTAILRDSTIKAKYIKGLDRLCDFFLSLKDSDGELVPVLFRPFHEHTGSWFWWGSDFCTVDEYKELWTMTQDYILEQRGVHNLLYIYSPDKTTDNEHYFERYPGDSRVDILGYDCYHRGGESTAADYQKAVKETLKFMSSEAEKRDKLFVFSETGLESLPMAEWFTETLLPAIEETHPVYVLVWRNAVERPTHHYAPYPGHPAAEDFVKFYEQENIVFENELHQIAK